MMKSEIIAEKNNSFFKELSYRYKISFFILFGSHARSQNNALSDIDIAYMPRKKLSLKKENSLFIEICSFYKRDDIDLVDLTVAPLLLKFSCIMYGKILLCNDKKTLYNFIVYTRREYLDTEHIRSIFNYYLAKRINEGRFGT